MITQVGDNDLAITQPADITTDAASPSGAVVTYQAPAVTDDEDPSPPTVVCTPISRSMFPVGTTTVQCSVTDPDDTPATVSSSFTITVKGAAAQLADLHQAVTTLNPVGPGDSPCRQGPTAQPYLAAGDVADT